MAWIHWIIDFVLHINVHLNAFAGTHPVGVYALMVAIIFCETGLVVTPFLPGDSLLFAVGALAASPNSPIHLLLVIVLLCAAANCGDMLNYFLGRRLGPSIFHGKSFLLNRKHLDEAQAFYDRHGRKTIIIARFVPIIRTFAPFVAGIGRMRFTRFIGFSIGAGILWVTVVSLAGYFFGSIKWVDQHFEVVVLGIIVLSVVPMGVHAITARKRKTMKQVEPVVS